MMDMAEIHRTAARAAVSILQTLFLKSRIVFQILEKLILIAALFSFCILIYLHGTYVYEPIPSLSFSSTPVISNDLNTSSFCRTCISKFLYREKLKQEYLLSPLNDSMNSMHNNNSNMPLRFNEEGCNEFVKNQMIIRIHVKGLVDYYWLGNLMSNSKVNPEKDKSTSLEEQKSEITETMGDVSSSIEQQDMSYMQILGDSIHTLLITPIKSVSNRLITKYLNDTTLVVFAQERGMLYLSKNMKSQLNISIMDVTIKPWNFSCFLGESHAFDFQDKTTPANSYYKSAFYLFIQYFIASTIGYETIFINEFMKYANNSGVIYSQVFNELYHLSFLKEVQEYESNMGLFLYAAYRLIYSPILLYLMTFLVTFYLLRSTQRNIVALIWQLQYFLLLLNVRQANQFRSQVTFFLKIVGKNILQNVLFVPIILGFIGFLGLYYQDRLVAVMVLSIIWASQIFMTLCSVNTSQQLFPWIFHFYLIVYIQYTFRYPFAFTYFACIVCILLVTHAVLFFWNHFEYSRIQRTHPLLAGMQPQNPHTAGPASTFPLQHQQRFVIRLDNNPRMDQTINLNLNNSQNVQIQLRMNPNAAVPPAHDQANNNENDATTD